MSAKTRNIVSSVIIVLMALTVLSMFAAHHRTRHQRAAAEAYNNDHYAQAVELFSRALERHEDAAILNDRGLAYLALEKYDLAMQDLTRAIELDPQNAVFYVNRGKIGFKTGSAYNFEPRRKALEDFDRAIELDPQNPDAYYHRALVSSEQIHYHHKYLTNPPKFPSSDMDYHNKAFADLCTVLTLDPDYVLAYTARGNLFYRHGDWDLSETEHNVALAREDRILEMAGKRGLAEAYNSRGRNRLAAGNLAETVEDFSRAIELYNEAATSSGPCRNITNALAHRTIAAWEMGRWQDTIDYANETIRVKETNLQKYGSPDYYYFTLGRCFYHLGRYDEAVANLEKGLSGPGYKGVCHYWLGLTCKAMGESDRARQEFLAAFKKFDKKVARDPENSRYKSNMRRGLCYTELGEYQKAIDDFKTVISWKVYADKPVNHTNYYLDSHKFMAVACGRAGRTDEARQYFKKTIELAQERGFDEMIPEIERAMNAL